MSNLLETYRKEIVPKMKAQFNYANIHQVPRLEKVVLNMGVGEAVQDAKVMDVVADDLARITGQKAIIRRAKKSIANFKLREGQPIGASVTLRKARMYEFVQRLVNVALPRVRDFRGIPRNAFDGNGNYSLGIVEQIIFPEIDMDKSKPRGLNVTFVTTAKTNEEGKALLEHFGFPFRK
jgi:large subunit ribosomal protein L5